MSRSEALATTESLRQELLDRAEALRVAAPASAESDAALAALTETAMLAFAEFVHERGAPPLPADHRLTATDVATVCSHLLEAADLQVFELGLWRSWAGTSRATAIDPHQMRGAPGD